MNDVIIRITEDGSVSVEETKDGVRSYKAISPDTLLSCINQSTMRGGVTSGLLPKGCISFTAHDDGSRDVYLLHSETRVDITYYSSIYPNFPLPRLVFGFRLSKEGRVSSCRLGVIANDNVIKPETKMFHYPLSNVSGFHLCTGNNTFPKCNSLHTLSSLPYFILSMDNNDDHFRAEHNKSGFGMRELLEHLRDKSPEYYYSDVLIPSGMTLNDFISGV